MNEKLCLKNVDLKIIKEEDVKENILDLENINKLQKENSKLLNLFETNYNIKNDELNKMKDILNKFPEYINKYTNIKSRIKNYNLKKINL